MKNTKSLSGAMNVLNSLKNIDEFSHKNKNDALKKEILRIHPSKIRNWQFHDRPENELGDIENLAKELKEIGQQQPCIVRKIEKDSNIEYELIIGERRWQAAKLADIDLLCLVREVSNHDAAIAQAAENNNRKDLSDYSKFLSYQNLISHNIIEQKDLIDKLNISKMQVSRLFSFGKIPEDIKEAVGDFSKVSSRTASEIVQLSAKGDKFKKAIISLADKIKSGNIGHSKLSALAQMKTAEKKTNQSLTRKVTDASGNHLFTWKIGNNSQTSISFSKPTAKKLHDNEKILNELTKEITEHVNRLFEKS